jgi:hypothetical protein
MNDKPEGHHAVHAIRGDARCDARSQAAYLWPALSAPRHPLRWLPRYNETRPAHAADGSDEASSGDSPAAYVGPAVPLQEGKTASGRVEMLQLYHRISGSPGMIVGEITRRLVRVGV